MLELAGNVAPDLILSGGLMLDYLAEKSGDGRYDAAARLIEDAVDSGFEANALRPMEFGGDMGTKAVTGEVLDGLTRRKS